MPKFTFLSQEKCIFYNPQQGYKKNIFLNPQQGYKKNTCRRSTGRAHQEKVHKVELVPCFDLALLYLYGERCLAVHLRPKFKKCQNQLKDASWEEQKEERDLHQTKTSQWVRGQWLGTEVWGSVRHLLFRCFRIAQILCMSATSDTHLSLSPCHLPKKKKKVMEPKSICSAGLPVLTMNARSRQPTKPHAAHPKTQRAIRTGTGAQDRRQLGSSPASSQL